MKNTVFLSFLSSLLLSAAPVWAEDPIDRIEEVTAWPGSNLVSPRNVNATGWAIVGMARNSNGNLEAFRWDNGTMTGLGFLGSGAQSSASDISDNGAVIVGSSQNGSLIVGGSQNGSLASEAFRWENGVMTGLGFLSGGTFSYAMAANSDASVIVGYGQNSSASQEAFRWENGTMTGLGMLAGDTRSVAVDVSSDGSIVVGNSSNNSAHNEAFRWENGTMTGLGYLGNSGTYSSVSAISGDGSVIVGSSINNDAYEEAFRWENGTMTGLGFLAGGYASVARDVNADGSIIVGYSENASLLIEAVVWTQGVGIQSVSSILTAAGVDMTNWDLQEAVSVSDSGQTILGYGTHNGQNAMFITNLQTGGLTTPVDMGNSLNTVAKASRQVSSGAIQQTSQGIFAAQNLSAISTPMATSVASVAEETGNFQDIMPAAGDFETVFSAFILGSYGVGQNNDFNNDQWNGTIGISAEVAPNLNIGIGIISQSSHEELDFKGESDMSAYGGIGLLAYEPGEEGIRIYATAFAADLSLEITRGYTNGAGLDSSSGETDGVSYGGAIKLGWEEEIYYGLTAMPYIEGRYSKTKLDAYAEEGGAFDASFSKQESNYVSSRIGIEFDYKANNNLNLVFRPAWGHRWSDDGGSFTADVGGLSQNLSSGGGDKNWAEMTIGAKYQATDKVKFTTELTGRSGDTGEPAATIMIGTSVRF